MQQRHVKATTPSQLALIATTVRTKGVPPPTTEVLPTPGEPCFYDNGDCIRGLWNILLYIEDRFPAPPLISGTPLRRATIRTLTNDLIVASDVPSNLARELQAYIEHIRPGEYIIDPKHPCLLDVALAVFSPPGTVWTHFQTLLTAVSDTDEDEVDEADSVLANCG